MAVEWFKSAGVGGFATGLKFVGVSGDVNKPGIFCVPMGTPMSEVLYTDPPAGSQVGAKLKAFAPSGPSSGYLPAKMVDVRLSFKSLADVGSMLGSGAVVVYAEGRCMLDNAAQCRQEFFRNESCREVRALPGGIVTKDGGYAHQHTDARQRHDRPIS